jgi:quercetin dioxygenase-like cupin family protein
MPLVDTHALTIVERLPGWRARIFHSAAMTFAHYEFDAGSTIHQHRHEQEEVWNVIEGELEVAIDGQAPVIAGPGMVAIVPPNTAHSVRALTDGKAIIVDHPLRADVGG